MKTNFIYRMKTAVAALAMIPALISCDNDDLNPAFVVNQPSESVAFTTVVSDNYLLSAETSSNNAERFVWNTPAFGAQTAVTYKVEGSTTTTFDVLDYESSVLSETNHAIKVSDLLSLATILNLDADPSTTVTDADGMEVPNNTGVVYFRVRALVGETGNDSAVESLSEAIPLNITIVEETGGSSGPNCPSIWVVGAGAVDAGWGWSTPIEFLCTDNVFKTNINLTNDAFRFFLTEGDWGSGQNYPYYIGEGFTIDSRFEDAMDGDNNFRFTGTPGNYQLTVDSVAKTIVLEAAQETPNCTQDSLWIVGAGATDAGWGWDTPIQVSCSGTGVFSTNINLVNDAFRFFLVEGDWGSGQNYPYYTGEGYTIDAQLEDAMDGDNNFRFTGTPGNYILVVDTANKTISLL